MAMNLTGNRVVSGVTGPQVVNAGFDPVAFQALSNQSKQWGPGPDDGTDYSREVANAKAIDAYINANFNLYTQDPGEQERIAGYQRLRQKNLEQAAVKRKRGLESQVDTYKKDLDTGVGKFIDKGGLIDQMLERELAQLGVGSQEARMIAGGNFAARGLVDSTVAGRGFSDLALGEIEQRGDLRLKASEMKSGIKTNRDNILTGLDQQKEELTQANDLASLEQASDLVFDIDVQQFQQNAAQILADMELDANAKAFTAQLLGGLFAGVGAIGGAFIGGPAGAIAGGTAGAAVGGAVG